MFSTHFLSIIFLFEKKILLVNLILYLLSPVVTCCEKISSLFISKHSPPNMPSKVKINNVLLVPSKFYELRHTPPGGSSRHVVTTSNDFKVAKYLGRTASGIFVFKLRNVTQQFELRVTLDSLRNNWSLKRITNPVFDYL